MNPIIGTLKPIIKDSLYIKISDAIYGYIKINNLQSGDKLPPEREMAKVFETSRNSVREALRILEDRGVIHVKVGSGAYINNPFSQNIILNMRLTASKWKDVQELQILLEHQLIEKAIRHGTVAEKQALVERAKEMVKLAEAGIYSPTVDHGFHMHLYNMAQSNLIYQVIIKIRDERFVWKENVDPNNDFVWVQTVSLHLDLAISIYEGNIEKALKNIDSINAFGYHLLDEFEAKEKF